MAGGFCAQPSPFSTWITKVKQSFNSERRKPYRPALERCSATMRDGLCFAWHSSLQLTLWGRMQNSTRGSLWLYLDSLYQRVFEFAPYIGWRRSEKEGLLAVLANLCQLFLQKKCWAGWEICSVITGALDRQNRITLILGFCLFPVL